MWQMKHHLVSQLMTLSPVAACQGRDLNRTGIKSLNNGGTKTLRGCLARKLLGMHHLGHLGGSNAGNKVFMHKPFIMGQQIPKKLLRDFVSESHASRMRSALFR